MNDNMMELLKILNLICCLGLICIPKHSAARISSRLICRETSYDGLLTDKCLAIKSGSAEFWLVFSSAAADFRELYAKLS